MQCARYEGEALAICFIVEGALTIFVNLKTHKPLNHPVVVGHAEGCAAVGAVLFAKGVKACAAAIAVHCLNVEIVVGLSLCALAQQQVEHMVFA